MRKTWILLALVVVMACSVSALTNLTSCKNLTTQGETYRFTANITANRSVCFGITAQYITLDCKGFSLIGNEYSIGVESQNINYTTIQNCNFFNISKGESAIFVGNVHDVNITNITGNHQYDTVEVGYAKKVIIKNVVTFDNNHAGVNLYVLNNSIVHNITVHNSTYGIMNFLDDGAANNLFYNIKVYNNDIGLYFVGSNNTIYNAKIYNNTLGFRDLNFGKKKPNRISYTLFNNTKNYYASTQYVNSWNTSYAGNYWGNWSSPSNGFSVLCTDANGDNICDTPNYNLSNKSTPKNVDYHPLKKYYYRGTAPHNFSGNRTNVSSASAGSKVKFNITMTDIDGISSYIFSYRTTNATDYTRTKYYYNKTYYMTDGVQDDIGLNGTAAVAGQSTLTRGWDTNGNNHCVYTNKKANRGSLSILCNATNSTHRSIIMFDDPNNTTFRGKIGFQMYIEGGMNGAETAISILNGVQSVQKCFGFKPSITSQHWYCGCSATNNCSTSSAPKTDTWFPVVLDLSDGTNAKFYVNNSLIFTYPSMVGLGAVYWYTSYTNASGLNVYYDDMWISNAGRPTTTAWVNETAVSVNATYHKVNNRVQTVGTGTVFNYTYYATDVFGHISKSNNYLLPLSNGVPSFSKAITTQNISHNKNLSYDVNCTDPEGDTITYFDNTTLFSINSTDGRIFDNPLINESGNYSIRIRCGDGTTNATATFTYMIYNSAPKATGFQFYPPNNNGSRDVTINFTTYDNQSDYVYNYTQWFKNKKYNATWNNRRRIGEKNFTTDNLTVTLVVGDGYKNSTKTNYTLVISDTTAPTIVNNSVDAATKTLNDVGYVYAACTDASAISAVKFYVVDPDSTVTSYTQNSAYASSTYRQQITYNKLGTWTYKNVTCTDIAGNAKTNTSVNINVVVSSAGGGSTPDTSGGGGGGASPQCTTDDNCLTFGLNYYCVNAQCVKVTREDLAYVNLNKLNLPAEVVTSLLSYGNKICDWNGVCQLEEGENINNCGDQFYTVDNKKYEIKGDCTGFNSLPQPVIVAGVVVIIVIFGVLGSTKGGRFR